MGILCCGAGGFGADFTQNSLLAKYRPDLLHLPTTNGEHCTGDGIKMGEARVPCSKRSGAAYATYSSCLSEYIFLGCVHGQEIGAKTIDLEWVQVHPTGLVKPDDADAKIKFLAAEATIHASPAREHARASASC